MKILNYQTNYSIYNTKNNNTTQKPASQIPDLLIEPQKAPPLAFTGWWGNLMAKLEVSNRRDTLNNLINVLEVERYDDSKAISVILAAIHYDFKPPTQFVLDKVEEIANAKKHYTKLRMQELLDNWEIKKCIKKVDDKYIMQVPQDLEFKEILERFEQFEKKKAKK